MELFVRAEHKNQRLIPYLAVIDFVKCCDHMTPVFGFKYHICLFHLKQILQILLIIQYLIRSVFFNHTAQRRLMILIVNETPFIRTKLSDGSDGFAKYQ